MKKVKNNNQNMMLYLLVIILVVSLSGFFGRYLMFGMMNQGYFLFMPLIMVSLFVILIYFIFLIIKRLNL